MFHNQLVRARQGAAIGIRKSCRSSRHLHLSYPYNSCKIYRRILELSRKLQEYLQLDSETSHQPHVAARPSTGASFPTFSLPPRSWLEQARASTYVFLKHLRGTHPVTSKCPASSHDFTPLHIPPETSYLPFPLPESDPCSRTLPFPQPPLIISPTKFTLDSLSSTDTKIANRSSATQP